MTTHLETSTCAAMGPLEALHPAEIAVALEALGPDDRDGLAGLIGLPAPTPVEPLRDELARQTPFFMGPLAHEVARRLVGPLVPAFRSGLDTPAGALGEDLEAAVVRLLDEWPPGLVHLLVALTWEAAGLPVGFSGRRDGS